MFVFPGRAVNTTVILGAHNLKKKEPSWQVFHVGHWVIHPNYSKDKMENDIMLLKVCPHTSFLLRVLRLLTSPTPLTCCYSFACSNLLFSLFGS